MIPAGWQQAMGAAMLAVVAIPLAVAVVCLVRPRLAFLLPWAVAPAAAALFLPANGTLVPWFFMGQAVGMDDTVRVFLAVTVFAWFAGGRAVGPLLAGGGGRGLGFFLGLAMAGNFGILLAADLPGFYLFFALLSLAGYGIVLFPGRRENVAAARRYLILVMVGEVALFTGLASLAHQAASGSMALLPMDPSPAAVLLVVAGLGVKIGLVPLQQWMIPAYGVTAPAAAALLAGPMAGAGVYGVVRLLADPGVARPELASLLLFLGVVGVFYGVGRGLSRTRSGEILACSSISQSGLVAVLLGVGMGSGRWDAVRQALVFFALHHVLVKTTLFLGLHGRVGRVTAWGQGVAALALAGLPLTSGAVVKHLLGSAGGGHAGLSLLFSLSTVATTVLMLHFLACHRRSPASGGGPAVGWYLGVAAVVAGPWLWPAARPLAVAATTPAAFSHLVPFLVTGWLLYRLLHRRFPLAGPTSRWRAGWRPGGLARLLPEEGPVERGLAALFAVLATAAPGLRRREKVLNRWSVAGATFLALVLALFWSLGGG